MKVFYTALLAVLAFAAITTATFANDDPLFVNLTTDENHRARMALVFASRQQQLGRPITLFLNDRGVLLSSTKNADKFKGHQEVLSGLIDKGATVLVCPMCMEHYGVDKTDLAPGLKLSNPEVVGEALFADDNTKSLTW